MGVPKFFRYISERYPNLSELVGIKEVSTIKIKKNSVQCKYCLDDEKNGDAIERKKI